MFIISFPRSGQHLFERLLAHIYDYYGKKFSYCEFYNCCRKIPCKKKCLFQKNHDFGLNLKIKTDEKFLILYRKDKILQLESFFRYENFFRKDKFNAGIDYENETNFNELVKYIKKKSKYYNRFVNKYVKSNQFKQALVVEYDDFLNNSKNYIKQLVLYLNLTTDENVDSDVENILNTFEKIEYKNGLDDKIYNKIYKILYPE